jgi:hypothetical protein
MMYMEWVFYFHCTTIALLFHVSLQHKCAPYILAQNFPLPDHRSLCPVLSAFVSQKFKSCYYF